MGSGRKSEVSRLEITFQRLTKWTQMALVENSFIESRAEDWKRYEK